MRQAFDKPRARGLAQCLLLVCVVNSVGVSSTSIIATPQDSNPSEIQSCKNHKHPPSLVPHRCLADKRAGMGADEAHQTYVEMPLVDLMRAVPELKNLTPTENQDLLPRILAGAGSAVAAFFENFPNTTCTEHIVSTVHKTQSMGILRNDDHYNYMALAEAGSPTGHLKEYRATPKGEPVQPDGIVTFGFVALSVNFHPKYQADSRFRYLGREEINKQNTYVVAFAQDPKVARLPASVYYIHSNGIVFLQGVAWIDPVEFKIIRLRTDIQQPEPHVGLVNETTQVLYSEQSFPKNGMKLWLPREVTVSGQMQDFKFHNLHRYSNYLLFNVQVEQTLAKP